MTTNDAFFSVALSGGYRAVSILLQVSAHRAVPLFTAPSTDCSGVWGARVLAHIAPLSWQAGHVFTLTSSSQDLKVSWIPLCLLCQSDKFSGFIKEGVIYGSISIICFQNYTHRDSRSHGLHWQYIFKSEEYFLKMFSCNNIE